MKFSKNPELEQYIEEQTALQRARYEAEFAEKQRQEKIAADRAAETAKSSVESNARREAMDLRSSQMYRTPRTPILCEVCGTLVEPDTEGTLAKIARHTFNGSDVCFRNPRLCAAYGIISREHYDDLTEQEKKGYVVTGAGLPSAVEGKVDVHHTAARANILDGGQRYEH